MRKLLLAIGLVVAVGGVTGAALTRSRPAGRLVKGECQAVFGSPVCVWARMSGDQVVSFGATVPYRVVADAPADGKMLWPPPTAAVIPLPEEVRQRTGFDHFEMSWEHHGHPPGPYLTPHFDFHFYTVPADRVRAIDCADATKPAAVPAGYVLPDITVPGLGELKGLCVPTMGMHGVPQSALAATTPFDQTTLLGYYGGALIFLEPMISRATLLEKKSFEGTVPVVASGPGQPRFPAKFRVDYDAAADAYQLVFTMAGGR
jgi:hypothetical protein